MERQLYYIADIATILGVTEAAIRSHIQRRSACIPRWVKIGKRIAWRKNDVDTWLDGMTPIDCRPARQRGRPSKVQLGAEGRLT